MSAKSFKIFLFLFVLLIGNSVFGQSSYYRYIVINNDTVPIVDLPVCYVGDITKRPKFKSKAQEKRYVMLEKHVKKVYPYANLASKKLKQYEKELAMYTKASDRQKVMKKVEKALKDQYGDELKNLTVKQGKILLKLIDRQTGKTSYELIKEMRGSFSVAMWQGFAVVFGHNLKSTYDATGEDWMIENIIRKIELGIL